MIDQIKATLLQVEAYEIKDKKALENFRLEYLSKKGVIQTYLDAFREVPNEQKKDYGAAINALKQLAEQKLKTHTAALEEATVDGAADAFDASLPIPDDVLGARHPLHLIQNRIIQIFERIGFNLSYGPEIEDDWHNFSALNFPPDHPAREMQDTFFIHKNPDITLRTHTSSVQVRIMETQRPPIRTLSPGRVYRNEAISARAHCFFHQIEGLYVDKKVSFVDLKQTLLYFAKEMFGKDTQIRLRPSFFPFTEPSAEIDVSCELCKGEGCNVCKHSGWVEIGGAGMVDPEVLKNCGIDPDEYTGFAFGMGLERITMLKYQIKDLRLFSENDLRFLRQFQFTL